jgi:hypothetical protein
LQPSESERVEKLQFHRALRLTVDRGWARLAPEIGSQQARDNRRKFRNTLRFWQLKG